MIEARRRILGIAVTRSCSVGSKHSLCKLYAKTHTHAHSHRTHRTTHQHTRRPLCRTSRRAPRAELPRGTSRVTDLADLASPRAFRTPVLCASPALSLNAPAFASEGVLANPHSSSVRVGSIRCCAAPRSSSRPSSSGHSAAEVEEGEHLRIGRGCEQPVLRGEVKAIDRQRQLHEWPAAREVVAASASFPGLSRHDERPVRRAAEEVACVPPPRRRAARPTRRRCARRCSGATAPPLPDAANEDAAARTSQRCTAPSDAPPTSRYGGCAPRSR